MSSLNPEPKNVGIRAFEFYFPRRYIEQTDFEKVCEFSDMPSTFQFNNESEGKYTKGLGLKQMGFCDDNEDVNSIALTATANLLERYNVDPDSIGFLAVGTETTIDRSKSVKTTLMELFPSNPDIEGVDVKNGCYGGTQVLLNAVDWVYSNWQTDGRYAIAVTADIAAYAPGPARCTGGAGAIAFLIGPDAPLVIERGLRAFHMANVYDFYKPCHGMSSEFPSVDATLSLVSYLTSIDEGYKRYRQRHEKVSEVQANDFAAIILHCPFYKLVQKGVARIYYQDVKAGKESGPLADAIVAAKGSLTNEQSYLDRSFLATAAKAADNLLKSKVEPNISFNQRIGNMYTASTYGQLVAFLARHPLSPSLNGQRILAYSYGSGSAAAVYSIKLNLNVDVAKKLYQSIHSAAKDAENRLDDRILVTPEKYTEAMLRRQNLTETKGPTKPQAPDSLYPGTFYLTEVDDRLRRYYSRTQA